jgi:diaminopimelate decarboxylase
VPPLTGRTEPWQRDLYDQPPTVARLIAEFGSPVNVLSPEPMARNAGDLRRAAAAVGIPLGIYLARKANKALCFVDKARQLGLGVDVASERELAQTLARGVAPRDVIVTAAVKPRRLLEAAARDGVLVAIDNLDEFRLLREIAAASGKRQPVAIRIAPEIPSKPPSRFGLTVADALALVKDLRPPGDLDVKGVHFHVDGYSAADRASGIDQSLRLVGALRDVGQRPEFVDIGGGIPMRYLDDPSQWIAFWEAHRAGLTDEAAGVTFGGHRLGLTVVGSRTLGTANVYPYAQPVVRGEWLSEVLSAQLPRGVSVAAALRRADVRLHCEPGRSLLDGCGITFARVEFRKPYDGGRWLVGLAMNRTQCRSTSDDFMVDPLLVPCAEAGGSGSPPDAGPLDAYLVGAYCIERELLTWRRLRFSNGVRVGDVLAFPNTAGYLMHILESASHQMPLACNVVVDAAGRFSPDAIDAEPPASEVDCTPRRPLSMSDV